MGSQIRRGLCRSGLALVLSASATLHAAAPHYVFAHYMVCFASYGATVDAYKREILEAQAAGIDGFALNVGAWDNSQPYYQSRVALIYNAAEQLGTGFKLFFSVDFAGESNVVSMVEAYANRTNSFRYNSRIVLSAYGHNDVPSKGWPGMDWTNAIIGKLRQDGYPVFFVPYFFSDPVQELPYYTNAQFVVQKYSGIVDGLFYFGGAGLPAQLAQCNSNYTAAVHAAGKISMAGFSPSYWGCAQPSLGRRYFEFEGGSGCVLQWLSLIQSQPDWIEIVTWNDFNESTYICPVEDPGAYSASLKIPRRYAHNGDLSLVRRYINWFKSGQEPAIDCDAVYCAYRTHSTKCIAVDTNDIPVSWFVGDVQDAVYTTTLLTAPAELEVISGTQTTTNALPAGLTNLRIPFMSGAQTLILRRNNQEVLSISGPPVLTAVTNYDYFVATVYADGHPPIPPTNLRVSGAQ